MAQAHDGSLGSAHAFIDAIANAGADAVKFQTHIADAESTADEPFRVPFSRQDVTRFAYWKRMEFTEAQWHGLARHAAERGLLFLSSPFSTEAVELLLRVGVPAWKVASGEVANRHLRAQLCATGLPLLLSSGLSTLRDLDDAVADVRARGVSLAVLQCTSQYPCPAEQVGLNLVLEFATRYQCPTGLSDHSGTIFPALAAATVGAHLIEVHVALSREAFGPDVPSSVTTGELRQLVEGVRFIERMQAHAVAKDEAVAGLGKVRTVFGRSVALRTPVSAGTALETGHLTLKKPGTGIPASRLVEIVGRVARRDLTPDRLLRPDDVEPPLPDDLATVL